MARKPTIPIAPKGPKKDPVKYAAPPPPPKATPSTPAPGKAPPSLPNPGQGAKSKAQTTKKTPDPYAAAQARADAKDRDAKRKASRRYIDQVATLQHQVVALRDALGEEFKDALNQKLRNVDLVEQQQDETLLREYNDRVSTLEGAAEDNEKAAAGQTYAALTNRGRERANAVSEAMLQGAGESDLMRVQEMSLRNWNQNQSEVNRSFFDTLRSVNSSLTDLTADTRTARINTQVQANADREQLWTNYFDQRSETYTQLGNVLGQQAEYLGMAEEAGPTGPVRGHGKGKGNKGDGKGKDGKGKGNGKGILAGEGNGPGKGNKGDGKPQAVALPGPNFRRPEPGTIPAQNKGPQGKGPGKNLGDRGKNTGTRRPPPINFNDGATLEEIRARRTRVDNASGNAFENAAEATGRAWENPGVDDALMRWEGRAAIEGRVGTNVYNPNGGDLAMARPEGATLRKW